jgi:hypothetical protein
VHGGVEFAGGRKYLDYHFRNSQEHCMKKLVFASAMALAGIGLVLAPALRAQAQDASGQISLPPDQFKAYSDATTQTDPTAKAAAIESFLQTYPQTPVKNSLLDMLITAYSQANAPDKVLSAASRMLQVDPNNMQAIIATVFYKKAACQKSVDASDTATDAQSCDDAAAAAQKGLTVAKPAGMSDDDWKKLTAGSYPIFHSAIAFDDKDSKKDFKGAIDEYTKELMLFPPDQCTKPGQCLADTLQLAQAYAKPGPSRDEVKAIWFYSRAWDFAPDAFKTQIEPLLDFWYTHYHGKLDTDAEIKSQIDAIKTQAQATLFPPSTFTVAPAPSAQELANKYCAVGPDDLKKLALADKEFLLANGSKDCTDKLWALVKDQVTPVPGIVIDATDSVIKIAVTQDAKDNKAADFTVNLKKPLEAKDIPAAGTEFKLQPAAELDGTYDTYTQVPAAGATPASVQIVLREGFVQPEKKAGPVHHTPAKPSAAHHPQ